MSKAMPINDLVSRCERLRGEGRLEEAENLCRRTLVQVAAHGGLLFQSAATAYARLEPSVALGRFKRVKAVLPGASTVHYNLGVCGRRMGRHAEAIRHLRKSILLEPGAAGAWDSLAQSEITLGNAVMAMAAAQRQVKLRPMSSATHATLGFISWRADRLDTGEQALRTALVLEPGARDADLNLGNVLARSGRSAEAIGRYRRLHRLDPLDRTLCGNLGVALIGSGDWRGASEIYARFARLLHGRPLNHAMADPFPDLPVAPTGSTPKSTAWHRLEFDAQQLDYLLGRELIPKTFESQLKAYQSLIDNLDNERRTAVSFDLSKDEAAAISSYHNRIIHLASTNWCLIDDEVATANQPALGASVDWAGAAKNYQHSTPAVAVIDDFLDPVALTALRKFCLESTIWFELKGAGYLGAYFREGFNDPLLIAIAEELSAKMPEIFENHPLRMIWAYTYEQSMVGINPHADFARINVNFWITPNTANLDPETGGLLIYRRPAPESWGFEKFNAAPGREIMEFLGEDARSPIRVPHRENRAVIFDSRLFHETDRLNFREGIENRRINITMLFGDQ
jgi:tetratricopeptide (TPR) repeat protein